MDEAEDLIAARGRGPSLRSREGRVIAGMVVALALLAAPLFIALQSPREISTPHHTPAWFTLLVPALVIGAEAGHPTCRLQA